MKSEGESYLSVNRMNSINEGPEDYANKRNVTNLIGCNEKQSVR